MKLKVMCILTGGIMLINSCIVVQKVDTEQDTRVKFGDKEKENCVVTQKPKAKSRKKNW